MEINASKLISQLLTPKKEKAPLSKEPGLTLKEPELSIILPCRNEEQALPLCLTQIKETIQKNNLNAELLISDSSTDGSLEVIKHFVRQNPGQLNIKIIKHNKEGYGIAYLEAFKHAKGKYVFMADCDGTYTFSEIPNFLNTLKQGYDFVIGNRFSKQIEKGAMPWSHKYIGNPILSGLLRIFFKTPVRDSHCGMRAISKQALDRLNLQTTGMEFASEMVMKALKNNLKIKQLPISYKKRIGESKLNTFSDGWRHLRFMLLYSPLFLFFIPGLILFLIGLGSLIWFYFTNPTIFGAIFYTHPMFLSSLLTIIGYQLIFFALFAKTYAITHLNEKSPLEKIFKHISIEKAGLIGILLTAVGIIIYIFILVKWISSGFGSLNQIKNSILALTLIIIGIQTISSGFMLSILGIKEK